MKKLFALLLALLLVMSFVACGDEEAKDGGKAATTFDAGNVKATVPAGWKAFAVNDIFAEDPSSADPDKLNLCKGAESEFDLYSKPYIQVVFYDASTTMVTPAKDFYSDAADMDPITAGELTWNGFTAKSNDLAIAILWATDANGNQFQLNCFQEMTDGKFAFTDADVLQILGGIQASK